LEVVALRRLGFIAVRDERDKTWSTSGYRPQLLI
jgi:hypothetical protein